jgi:peptidoglycan/xylan/chitin deacetylase (PgdA/CDA1 family)
LPTESPTTSIFTRSSSGEEGTRTRPKWRELVAKSLYRSGVLRILEGVSHYYEFAPRNSRRVPLLRRAKHSKFAILCYHRIGTGGIPLFSELPPDVFEAEMRFLRSHYKIVSLDELCKGMEKPTRNEISVAVTFDDGYRDLYTHALPTLKKYRIPATIYLPVMSIETGQVPWYDRIFLTLKVFPKDVLEVALERPRRFHLVSRLTRLEAATEIIQYLRTLPDARRKELCENLEKQVTLPSEELRDRMLTWDQIQTMCREGITFGSHTMTHPVVSQLTRDQLESEISESKQLLEQRIMAPAPHFAFPFGKPADCGKAAPLVLARSGYRSAATTTEGTNVPGDSLYELRRTQVGSERSISMFAFKLNQLFLSPGGENSATVSAVSSPTADKDFPAPGRRQIRPSDA